MVSRPSLKSTGTAKLALAMLSGRRATASGDGACCDRSVRGISKLIGECFDKIVFVEGTERNQKRADPLPGRRLLEQGFGKLCVADELGSDQKLPELGGLPVRGVWGLECALGARQTAALGIRGRFRRHRLLT